MVAPKPKTPRQIPHTIACIHHWRIERPDGETSRGRCKLCGASRDFRNYSYYPATSRTRAALAKRGRGASQQA